MRTKNGCVLILVRLNAKKECPCGKRLVIVQHGVFGSSDDFAVNPPYRGLGKTHDKPSIKIDSVPFMGH